MPITMAEVLARYGADEANSRIVAFAAPFEEETRSRRDIDPDAGFQWSRDTIDRARNELDLDVGQQDLYDAFDQLTGSGYEVLGENELATDDDGEQTVYPRFLLPRRGRREPDELGLAFFSLGGNYAVTRRPAAQPAMPLLTVAGQPIDEYLAKPVRRNIAPNTVVAQLDTMLDGIGREALLGVSAAIVTGQLAGATVTVTPPATTPTQPTVSVDAQLGTLQQELSTDEFKSLVDCWLHAGYHTYWWGWSVCLDRPCADLLQSTLFKLAGAKASNSLYGVIKGWIGGTLTASSKASALAAGGPLAVVLLAIGLYIAVMIAANKTSRGVCISGLWSFPLIGSGLVWAKGR